MSNGSTYTYRNGQRIELEKQPDQFVVRALPDELGAMGIASDAVQVSSASSRVFTRPNDLEADMSRSRHVAPTHHAYYETGTGTEFLITDRLFVTFHEGVTAEQVDAFAGKYSLVHLESYGDRDHLFQLTNHTGMNPVKLLVKLIEDDPLVETADHDLNQQMSTYQLAAPTDPAYARQWHLHARFHHAEVDTRSSTRCEEAWQLLDHFGSPDVVVGVTDDGCKLTHPDFDSPGKFAAWGYFRGSRLITKTDFDADPNQMYKSGSNHGTSCAGVIAGEVDAVLTVGAAPGCRLLPIQWESSGSSLFISDSKILTMLNFVADKVDILSNSWGGTPVSTWAPQVVNLITQLAQTGGRRGRGILFLWAAGNENCPIQHDANVDVPYTNGWQFSQNGARVWVGVRTARRFRNNLVGIPGLMHVAALASTGQRSHYSNYGSGILITAPTSNVHDYGRLTVRGLGITTATGSASEVTDFFGGTSSATPLVAGIAALTISANPDLTALEVAAILKQTASKDLSMAGYSRTPPASYDPNPTWDVSPVAPFDRGDFTNNGDADGSWSPWFGHGRIDAANAVAAALARLAPPNTQTLRQVSTPALDIPDNDPAGVRDTLHFSETVVVAAIKVTVDIRHTYQGDLRVQLIAPSGTAVFLHNREGGSANNIRQSYDMTNTLALSSLIGEQVSGDWSLHIQDMARIDVGQLRQWEIEIEAQPDTTLLLEEAPGTKIPDNKPAGIQRQLSTTETGQVKEVEVAIDITHTYIGDLIVTLTSPAGTPVPLHQRTGRGKDNLIETYRPATTPALRSLHGEPVQGTWWLKIVDMALIDVGKLNRWAVKIVREV